jgi:DMSO/TMAO reductase YedYZ molybdopterin-dependent catalytic subunit
LHQSRFTSQGSIGVKRATLVLGALVLMFCGVLSAAGETAASEQATVRVSGKVERPIIVSEAVLQTLPRKRLAVTDEKGAQVTYEGVPVVELLQRAGAPLGKQLKGVAMRLFVVVEASDGYQAVFALPEFDPDFTDRVIIMADRKNGKAMLSPEGPFRLIVEGEKRHARWVREVTALDVEEAR